MLKETLNFLLKAGDLGDINNTDGWNPNRYKKYRPKPAIRKTKTGIPIIGQFVDSAIDNIFKDMVKPLEGCIVHCGLAHVVEHSGIYIGNGEIVHLDGNGRIEAVTPRQFLERLDGLNTAMGIYVSCIGTDPIRSRKIANRAKARIGQNNGYSLFSNNCHRFSSSCITGDLDNNDVYFSDLEKTTNEVLGVNEWRVWDLPYKK